jgi:hypothetical protein
MLLKLLVIILLADFISGFVHWLEDAYARPEMPWVGGIARENLLHHDKPRDFLKSHCAGFGDFSNLLVCF